MRYKLSGVGSHADRRDATPVYHEEVRALLQEAGVPMSNGVEWIIEKMEARGREAT